MAPVAVVPIEEKEPEVDLDRLARVENAEEEVGPRRENTTRIHFRKQRKGSTRSISLMGG